jgi:hypothetical protein
MLVNLVNGHSWRRADSVSCRQRSRRKSYCGRARYVEGAGGYLAILAVKPGTRHFDLHPAEGPRQRPRPMAMPVTGDSDQAIIIVARRFWAPTVSPAHQCRIELALNRSLNKFAHPIAYPSFDRIEPVVEQINRCVGGRLRGIRLRANALHGVVSSPAHQRRMIRG